MTLLTYLLILITLHVTQIQHAVNQTAEIKPEEHASRSRPNPQGPGPYHVIKFLTIWNGYNGDIFWNLRIICDWSLHAQLAF